jgi:CHAT domain-containing protein/Tfp pilus assembly protein PilF
MALKKCIPEGAVAQRRNTYGKVSGFFSRVQAFATSTPGIATAIILILCIGLGIWWAFFHQSEVDKGMAALAEAYHERRLVEVRISQLPYAPMAKSRGEQESVDQLSRDRAERILLDAVFQQPDPASYHALGKLYLAEQKFDRAITQFEQALKTDSNNARLHSDYGAALLEIGRANKLADETGKSMDEFARSLEHLNKALQLDDSLLDALFNRALLYESMILPQQAEDNWEKYLEKDPNSGWADEAQRHLHDLKEKQKARLQSKNELLTEFVRAYRSRDGDKAYDLISENTDAISGQMVWWQLLSAYLDSSLKREGDKADEYLKALSYAGEVQQQKTSDQFVSVLAEFYASASPRHLESLAQAHTILDQAHALLVKSKIKQAIELYIKAKAIFYKTGNQLESRFTSYWIGYSLYRNSEFKKSLLELSNVAEYGRLKGYFSLLERALTMIANIHVEADHFSTSLAFFKESLEISKKTNDQYGAQKNLTALAYTFKNLGNRKESLAYIHNSLERANSCWPGARQMYRSYDAAAEILTAFGYYTAAVDYEKAALQFALEAKDPEYEHVSYLQLGAIYATLQDYSKALAYAQQSYELAKEMSNTSTSLRPVAFSSLQLAHIYRQMQDHDMAAVYYDDAIRICKEIDLFAYLYEGRKGRLLCSIDQGNDSLAEEELKTVLTLFEEHRSKIKEEKNRNSFFDMEQYVYDIAIDFEYSRKHNFEKAFEYSEISRARSLYDMMTAGAEIAGGDNPDPMIASVSQPLILGNILEKLPEQVQILQYSVLDDKLLVWVVSHNKFDVREQNITSQSLTEKVLNYWKSLSIHSETAAEKSRRNGIELYELLIKPVEALLEKEKQICVVPDKALNYLPFNALVSPDTGSYLISDYLVSFAPSTNTFLLSSDAARKRSNAIDERVLSVGDPRFNRAAFPELSYLPSSGKEAEEISRCYRLASCLVSENAIKTRVTSEMVKADVIHLASHYILDEYNPMLSKLLLTQKVKESTMEEASDGVLYAYDIYRTKLPLTRLVTLSACQTGVEQYYKGEGMIGMSRTFLAASVPLVVASLWPVDSDSTAGLMISFHEYRKHGGMSSVQALRQAQLDMIKSPQCRYASPHYWAPFITIGGYTTF